MRGKDPSRLGVKYIKEPVPQSFAIVEHIVSHILPSLPCYYFINMAIDKHIGAEDPLPDEVDARRTSLAQTDKSFWERLWPVIACGAGLFSDGYLNGVIGSVSTMLATIYPTQYAGSAAQSNVSAITFVGTVVGQLVFGYTSDHYSRKWSLFVSTCILILFAILCTASYGAGGSASGLFAALTAYRFFLGIGIGGGKCTS